MIMSLDESMQYKIRSKLKSNMTFKNLSNYQMAHGNILVTGCDSGLGLEFVRYLSTLDEVGKVYAGYMDLEGAKELQEVAMNPKVRLIKLLVNDDESIAMAKEVIESVIEDEGLNLLVNNAAIHERDYWLKGHPKREVFLEHYNINTVGPIMITSAFLPLLHIATKQYGKSIVLNISSDLASIKVARDYQCNIGKGIGIIAYGITKCALNHFTSTMAYYETKNGVISVAVHPGLMRTQMGGPTAPLGADEAAKKIIEVVNKVEVKDSGRYMDNDGHVMEF